MPFAQSLADILHSLVDIIDAISLDAGIAQIVDAGDIFLDELERHQDDIVIILESHLAPFLHHSDNGRRPAFYLDILT